MIKKVVIVGNGKLIIEIIQNKEIFDNFGLEAWVDFDKSGIEPVIIVHAGSGRELDEILIFCKKTNSILVELSTGLKTEQLATDFTLIVCPNISILLLKTLAIFDKLGHYFKTNSITITESHQADKKSVAGTAHAIAQSLSYPAESIVAIRDRLSQKEQLAIPDEYLEKHAYHKIEIQDGLDKVTIETKVLGHLSYVNGLQKLLSWLANNNLEKRKYSILELIDFL